MLPNLRQMSVNVKARGKWLSTETSKQKNFQAKELCLDVTSPPLSLLKVTIYKPLSFGGNNIIMKPQDCPSVARKYYVSLK